MQKKESCINISEKLDKVFLNKWFSFPIFMIIMFLIYYLSVGVVGNFTVNWITSKIDEISRVIELGLISIGTSEVITSLVIDGIIKGVGAVSVFIPQLVILFLSISLLETTGYMSRIALLLDKVFRKIGLSGKSLIPFIVGSGCSVPGIMGTRIIEKENERKMTVILTPFIPCSAKLPIIAMFSGYFFKDYSGFVSVSLYFLAIVVIIISALIMKKFVYKNTNSTYISELPEYKLPNIKYIVNDVLDKVFSFIKRAGSVILVCSIVIWFLLSFSFDLEYGVNIEKSILASIGKVVSWVFYPIIGVNSWEATVSALQGLIAKEQVISSMSVISGLAEETSKNAVFSSGGIFNFFTKASAYSFVVFNLFSAPCFGAIGAMEKELGGSKKVLKAIAFQTIIAWILASIIYKIGNKIENGIISVSDIIATIIVVIIIIKVILNANKKRKNRCENCICNKSCSN